MSTVYENKKEMDFKKWNAECGLMSGLELRAEYGLECNLCRHFDEELETCDKKHRLRKKELRDGPHSSCYVRIFGGCTDFEAREGVIGFLV